jgi:hypothetical protein
VDPLLSVALKHGAIAWIADATTALPYAFQVAAFVVCCLSVPCMFLLPILGFILEPNLGIAICGTYRVRTDATGVTVIHRGREERMPWSDVAALVHYRWPGFGYLRGSGGHRTDLSLAGYDREVALELSRVLTAAAGLEQPAAVRSLPLVLRCERVKSVVTDRS